MKCPACTDTALVVSDRQGVEIDYCPHLLMPTLDEPEPAMRHYAAAFSAALIASGTAPDVAAPVVEPLAWSDLKARACRSDNDHAIKLVYTCLRESQAYGDNSYRQIATLAVAA